MKKDRIEAIFEFFRAQNPEPKTELIFQNAYECLIAVMLSAQTTDIQVNKVTSKLFAVANTPEKMVALGEAGVINFIKHIGLFRNKAKHAIGISKMLLEQHSGVVPRDINKLQALPGVGRKTALVVLNAVFKENTLAVDTHVHRVSHRIGFIHNCKTPLQTERELLKIIPKIYLFNAHHWLILHGRYVCKARRPLCESCGINKLCEYNETTNKD